MIKFDMSGERCHLECEGDPLTLAADVGNLIAGIYSRLKNADPALAELFRAGVVVATAPDDAPTWTEAPQGEGVCVVAPRRKKE